MIKECLLFFGLGLFLYQLQALGASTRRWFDPLLALFAMASLFLLKFYVLMSLLPAVLFFAWSKGRPVRAVLVRFGLVYGAFIAVGLNLQRVIRGMDILGILTMKQRDFVGLAVQMKSGSFVMPELLLPELKLFLAQAPYALYITLLGPLVYAGPGPLGLISAAENLGLVLFLAACVVFHRPWKDVNMALVLALLGYITLLALVIGWTTPVMGAVTVRRCEAAPVNSAVSRCARSMSRSASMTSSSACWISALGRLLIHVTFSDGTTSLLLGQ